MLKVAKKKVELYFNNVMSLCEKISIDFSNNKKKYSWLFGLSYKFIMDLYFILVMNPIYGYLGLFCNPSIINYSISWIIYVLGYYMILKVQNQMVSAFLHIQWMMTITPVIIIYGLQSEKSVVYLLFILAVVLVQVLIGKKEKKPVPISFGGEHLKNYVTVFLCISVVAVWVIMAVWNDFAGLHAFDWDYIYEMRRNLVYPPLFRYIISWITRAIIPWLLIWGLESKSVFLIAYSIFMQVFFYMLLGFKMPLLIMAIIICVYIIAKIKLFLTGFYAGLISASAVGIIGRVLESLGTENTSSLFNALYGMRTLFYPAMVKYQFYEFFSEYPKVYFADGMIGKLLSQTNIYANSLGVTIYAFFNNGRKNSQSNTGYMADSYAQMGFIGMIVIGVLVILIIKFISKYKNHVSDTVLYCIIVCCSVNINDTPFFTSLLTGGIWLLLLMLMIYAKGGAINGEL